MKRILILLFIILSLKGSTQVLYGFNENSYPSYDNDVFIDSIASLHIDIIRYPDGIGSNFFDWKNTSKYNTLPYLRKMQQKVGCDILFVLNMNTSTIAYQLEMLDSAAAIGIPIKYVEFGSEVNNVGNALLKRFHGSGIEYGTECSIWAAAIKSHFPNVKFAAWGENKSTYPTWYKDLLSVYTPDAVVTHLYPNDTVISKNGIIDTNFLRHVIDKSFERSGIDFSLPVWVTEYNLNPHQLKYLKKGQHRIGLLVMSDELKRLGCKMLIMHSLSQGINGAFEVHTDGTVRSRITGRAMRTIMRLNGRL